MCNVWEVNENLKLLIVLLALDLGRKDQHAKLNKLDTAASTEDPVGRKVKGY